MGQVYEEFVRDLARWRAKYSGDPRREIIHLLLLGLEREEIVIETALASPGRRAKPNPAHCLGDAQEPVPT
jgi:hypothetical protein